MNHIHCRVRAAKAVPEIPVSDKPLTSKRNEVNNLTNVVGQLQEISQNIQDNSNTERVSFGNFVTATVNNLQ